MRLGLVIMSGVLATVALSSAAGVDGGMHTLSDGAVGAGTLRGGAAGSGTLRDGVVAAGTLRGGAAGSGTLRDGVVAAGGCTVCGLVVPWRMVMSCCSAAP